MQHSDLPREWAREAATHPEFTSRLSRLGANDGTLVLEHIAEASHSLIAAMLGHAAAQHGRKRIWFVAEMPRHRERLAAELEL